MDMLGGRRVSYEGAAAHKEASRGVPNSAITPLPPAAGVTANLTSVCGAVDQKGGGKGKVGKTPYPRLTAFLGGLTSHESCAHPLPMPPPSLALLWWRHSLRDTLAEAR